jgi:cytochrome c oxidase subunit 2
MRGLKTLAIAAALAFSCGSAMAQEAATGDSVAADVVKATEAAGVNAAEVAKAGATTGQTTLVPTVGGGLANAGTQPDASIGHPLGGHLIQPQVTALGERASNFNTALLVIMSVITVIVFALLFWATLRFRRSRNPVPSKTAHNTIVEVIWTVLPVLILIGIAIPSFQLLAAQYSPPKADLTIKATGHQWYWSYEYPDQGGFGFDSIMLSDEDAAKAGEAAKLGVDNRIVVPAGAVVKMLVTSSDVVHSWAMPAFWVKMDAVPGKINETWFKTDRPGVYYGQCSELCGTRHGFMPIAVEVVPQDKFDAWVAARQADAGIEPTEVVSKAPPAVGAGSTDVEVPTAAPVEPPAAPQPTSEPAPTGTVTKN